MFGNDCLANKTVEEWPIVDCLIAFYSDGFPLAKAIEYSELRRPFLVNDLKSQLLLLNRHTVYNVYLNTTFFCELTCIVDTSEKRSSGP